MDAMTSSREPLRLVRGAAAATVTTAVALTGHLLGGGELPAPLGIAITWWLAVTACTVLAGTRFSLLRLGAAVLGSQALFHALFVVATGGSGTVTMVDPPGSQLYHHQHTLTTAGGAAGAHAGHLAQIGDAASTHAAHGLVMDPRMLLGHVLAGLLTTLLLHRGERFLFRAFGAARRLIGVLGRLPAPAAPVLVPAARPRPVPDLTHLDHAQRAVLSEQVLRGPPLLLAA